MPMTPEVMEESRKIRRLRIMVDLTTNVLLQQPMTVDEAYALVASLKNAALALFPDKQETFDIVLQPRFDRLIRERFRTAIS